MSFCAYFAEKIDNFENARIKKLYHDSQGKGDCLPPLRSVPVWPSETCVFPDRRTLLSVLRHTGKLLKTQWPVSLCRFRRSSFPFSRRFVEKRGFPRRRRFREQSLFLIDITFNCIGCREMFDVGFRCGSSYFV